jgi:hypothetical protein
MIHTCGYDRDDQINRIPWKVFDVLSLDVLAGKEKKEKKCCP